MSKINKTHTNKQIMLESDQNCLVEKCVQMSCNNTSNKSNDIAKDKITNSNSNKKKKHKKNGLINGVTNCQQVANSTTTTAIEIEEQQTNGLVINDNSEANTITQLDSNDNISTDNCNEFCELLNSSKDGGDNGESMACCSDSRIDQQLEGCEIDNLTHNLNKIDLVEDTNKLDDDKRKNLPLIKYVQYESELQMPMIMKIIQKDLSEPYSIYTYRYFIHNWPKLCFLAMCEDQCVGAIVCKLDIHRKLIKRGYIAMLAVDQNYRKLGIGSTLVRMAIKEMILGDADEVVLETEVTNQPALQLYEALGFVRDKRLFRYYLNGVDALRLKLWLR